jgi:hypothetical protein
MSPEEIGKRKEELLQQIADANEELKILRKTCKHEDFFIGLYQWSGPGHHYLQRVCKYCGEPLGAPSPKELEQYEKEEEKRREARKESVKKA